LRVLLVTLSEFADVVEALPAAHDVRDAHPQVRIDWAVDAAVAPLLRRVDGVGELFEAPVRRWRAQWWSGRTRAEWHALRQRLRREPYDVVLDLQGSVASVLLARAARGPTAGPAHGWLLGGRRLAVPASLHGAQRARALVAGVLGRAPQGAQRHALRGRLPKSAQPTVVFAHGSNGAHKLWPESRWVALARHFNDEGWLVVLPHGNEFEQVRAERLAAAIDVEVTAFGKPRHSAAPVVQVWPRLSLDAMVDRLGAAHGLIGVDDGGLSRLAAALGLPRLSLSGTSLPPNVDEVWTAWRALRRGS
jgi:heptosyltransferase-1